MHVWVDKLLDEECDRLIHGILIGVLAVLTKLITTLRLARRLPAAGPGAKA